MANGQGQILKMMMAAILLSAMFFVAREGAVYVHSSRTVAAGRPCVVIDAGHGGGCLR